MTHPERVKAEWDKAHAESGGFLAHQYTGPGACKVCWGREYAAEHIAYTEARAGATSVEVAAKSNPEADAETERIKESAKTDKAKGVHKFEAAKWTHPNGHPRCKVCGQEESISPECNRAPTQQERDDFDAQLKAEFGDLEAAAAKLKCADCGQDYFTDEVDNPKHENCPEAAAYTGSGCMVALYINDEAYKGIEVNGDLPVEAREDLHITLAYMKVTPEGEELDKLKSVVQDMARTQEPMTGVWGGTARFNPSEGSDGKPVLVALPDLPDLASFREELVEALDAAGFTVAANHGYTPHCTIAYDDNGRVRAEGPISFDTLSLATQQRFDFPLTGEIDTDPEGPESEEAAATDPLTSEGWMAAGKLAQGVDAAVDDALTHLRSCADLPPYALQAQAVLQGIEPACDALLAWFGVSDADDDPKTDSELSFAIGDIRVPSLDYVRRSLMSLQTQRELSHELAASQASKHAEGEQIKFNKTTSYSKRAHEFIGSTYQIPQVCMMCGSKPPESGGICAPDGVGDNPPVQPDQLVVAKAVLQVRDRVFAESEALELPKEKAFLTEVNGKTLITGPASVMDIEKAMTPNEHFLWMQGRFVGAEKANRNGAFWTTADLEMGEPTVRYGPLNWLHEAKHIIGTLADQRLVHPTAEMAAEGEQSHIWTLSPIWKWIYPDEAYVVEQASDSGKLWYSMECVSKEVECVGDGGCGAKASYTDYLQASKGAWSGRATAACEHMRQKSAVRRFAEPTFLGGAVIVPPVRPGWADADASVLRQAAAYSEKAFEDAGQPDMTATEWEHLMADVLRFATS